MVFSTERPQMHMKAIVPMLVMVVTVFILCWTPILIFEVIKTIIIPRLLIALSRCSRPTPS